MATKEMSGPLKLRVFEDDTIENYRAKSGEPFVDGRDPLKYKLRLGNALLGGVRVGEDMVAGGVAKPYLVSPQDGGEIPLEGVIFTSRFNGILLDKTPDTHTATYWEIATDEGFSNKVLQTGASTTALTVLDLSVENVTLEHGTTYYVRFAYVGTAGIISYWSDTYVFEARYAFGDSQLAKLEATDAAGDALLGESCSISKDKTKALLGAPGANKAYLYTGNSNGTWTQSAILTGSDLVGGESFGSAVEISGDGNYFFVGAASADAVYVFGYVDGSVQEISKITGTGNFGARLDAVNDGSILAISAPQAETVYLYQGTGGNYAVQKTIVAPSAGNGFGCDVAINSDGTKLAVGAYLDSTIQTRAGAVYLYTINTADWTHTVVENRMGTGSRYDYYGWSVDLSDSGLQMAVGAYRVDNGTSNPDNGAVYVVDFETPANSTRLNVPTPNNSSAYGYLGYAVAISSDGQVILGGAYLHDTVAGGNAAGVCYLYSNRLGSWENISKLEAADGTPSANLGRAVALSSDGSFSIATAPGTNTGAAYVFN